jgi:hypothetical protein
MIKSVAMSVQPIKKAKRPRVVVTFETKLRILRSMEADICAPMKSLLK